MVKILYISGKMTGATSGICVSVTSRVNSGNNKLLHEQDPQNTTSVKKQTTKRFLNLSIKCKNQTQLRLGRYILRLVQQYIAPSDPSPALRSGATATTQNPNKKACQERGQQSICWLEVFNLSFWFTMTVFKASEALKMHKSLSQSNAITALLTKHATLLWVSLPKTNFRLKCNRFVTTE